MKTAQKVVKYNSAPIVVFAEDVAPFFHDFLTLLIYWDIGLNLSYTA